MARLDKIALWVVIVGAALVVAGVIIGPPEGVVDLSIQGAYFNRDVGSPAFADDAHAPVSSAGLLDPSDGNLWLGAGIALLAAGVLVLFTRRLRARRAH